MKIGLMLPAMQSMELNELTLHNYLSLNCKADSLWLPDHLLGIANPAMWSEYPASAFVEDPDAWLDPFCVAAFLGRQTELTFGTCVTDGTRRRGGDLARTVLTLNNHCRGGFVLGIGAGEVETLVPFGYGFSTPVGHLEQTLKDLRSLIDTGHMPEGIGRTGLTLKGPKGKPQIWVSGMRERSLKLTGLYGDGWMPLPLGLPAEEYVQKLAYLNKIAASVDRPPLTGSLFQMVLLGDSHDHVVEVLEKDPLGKLMLLFAPATLWKKHGMEHPGGPHCRGMVDIVPHLLDPALLRETAPRIPIELCEEFMLMGNAEEIAQHMRPYAEAGLEHALLSDITGFTYSLEETHRLMKSELAHLIQLLSATPVGNACDLATRIH